MCVEICVDLSVWRYVIGNDYDGDDSIDVDVDGNDSVDVDGNDSMVIDGNVNVDGDVKGNDNVDIENDNEDIVMNEDTRYTKNNNIVNENNTNSTLNNTLDNSNHFLDNKTLKETLTHFKQTDKTFYNSLTWITKNSITNILDLTFSYTTTIFDTPKTIDLIPNGRKIKVTDKTKIFIYKN
ncbi:e3 ubiquitin-protein ligase pub1 [Vairimorpha apis BRL 01]|uniref:HECT-type E3 ubiquitin transferase n=1 Tax=Vairimorpha apis BRL 01 TaxID=1037528 RepID=T0L3T5_9MICR|nr:e3 ubiquitin-protein ligase pub1 [Vairimorpha apis BRL 01]